MLAVRDRTVFLSGLTFGAFPGQTSSGSGLDDSFVRTYDARGNEGWTLQFGPGFALGIAVDEDALFVGGGSIIGLFAGSNGYVLQLLVDDGDDKHE
jgi:hypothetical protein